MEPANLAPFPGEGFTQDFLQPSATQSEASVCSREVSTSSAHSTSSSTRAVPPRGAVDRAASARKAIGGRSGTRVPVATIPRASQKKISELMRIGSALGAVAVPQALQDRIPVAAVVNPMPPPKSGGQPTRSPGKGSPKMLARAPSCSTRSPVVHERGNQSLLRNASLSRSVPALASSPPHSSHECASEPSRFERECPMRGSVDEISSRNQAGSREQSTDVAEFQPPLTNPSLSRSVPVLAPYPPPTPDEYARGPPGSEDKPFYPAGMEEIISEEYTDRRQHATTMAGLQTFSRHASPSTSMPTIESYPPPAPNKCVSDTFRSEDTSPQPDSVEDMPPEEQAGCREQATVVAELAQLMQQQACLEQQRLLLRGQHAWLEHRARSLGERVEGDESDEEVGRPETALPVLPKSASMPTLGKPSLDLERALISGSSVSTVVTDGSPPAPGDIWTAGMSSARFEGEYAELQAKLSSFQSETSQLSVALNEQRTKLAGEEAACANARSLALSEHAKAEDLCARVGCAPNGTNGVVDHTSSSSVPDDTELQKLQGELARVKDQAVGAEGAARRLQGLLRSAEAGAERLRGIVAERDACISELGGQLRLHESQEQVQKERNDEELQCLIAHLKTEVADRDERLAGLVGERIKLHATAASQEESAEEFRAALATRDAELAELREAYTAREQIASEAQGRAEREQEACERWQRECAVARRTEGMVEELLAVASRMEEVSEKLQRERTPQADVQSAEPMLVSSAPSMQLAAPSEQDVISSSSQRSSASASAAASRLVSSLATAQDIVERLRRARVGYDGSPMTSAAAESAVGRLGDMLAKTQAALVQSGAQVWANAVTAPEDRARRGEEVHQSSFLPEQVLRTTASRSVVDKELADSYHDALAEKDAQLMRQTKLAAAKEREAALLRRELAVTRASYKKSSAETHDIKKPLPTSPNSSGSFPSLSRSGSATVVGSGIPPEDCGAKVAQCGPDDRAEREAAAVLQALLEECGRLARLQSTAATVADEAEGLRAKALLRQRRALQQQRQQRKSGSPHQRPHQEHQQPVSPSQHYRLQAWRESESSILSPPPPEPSSLDLELQRTPLQAALEGYASVGSPTSQRSGAASSPGASSTVMGGSFVGVRHQNQSSSSVLASAGNSRGSPSIADGPEVIDIPLSNDGRLQRRPVDQQKRRRRREQQPQQQRHSQIASSPVA